jgi:type I restriction enzyme S subunit
MTPKYSHSQHATDGNGGPPLLPHGWRRAPLREVCSIIAGQSPPGETYRKSPEGLPFFQGKADFGPRHPVARTWCIAPNKIASVGDILISVRAPVGPTNVADLQCCIGRGLAAIRPREGLADRDFILAALKLYESDLAQLGSGSTFQAINREVLEALPIPLPPISEQRRIAARLDEQLAGVAQAHAAVQAQTDAAQALSAAQLRAAFTNTAATRWPKCRLGSLLRLRKEVVHPRDNPSGPAVFVGLEHVQSLTGERNGSLPVEMSQLTGRKPRFYTGDIVYGYLRPYLNKLWVAEFDGLCSVDQYVYEVNREKAKTDFVAWFMRSPVYLERAPIGASPGQLPRIRTEEVASVEINLPPLSQQRALVAQIQSEFTETTALKQTLSARLTALDHLPAALLREAFNGRV